MPHPEYFPFNRDRAVDGDIHGEPTILQKQVGAMEGEVKEIQMELASIRRERFFLSRKNADGVESEKPEKPGAGEEYADKKKSYDECDKSPKVSQLQEELLRAKNLADEERFQKEKYERKLKDLELKLNCICSSDITEVKQYPTEEITALKKQIRDLKEESEELKISLNEKTDEVQDYRMKYLQAQQRVEELKRDIDVIDFDNKKVSDHIQVEIQKMKMLFQDKLQELAPLPDLLKGAQIQLQEAKQLQKLAEDSGAQLSTELLRIKEKLVLAVNNLNMEKADKVKLLEENKSLKLEVEQRQKDNDDLSRNIDEYKCTILRMEEKLSQQEMRYKEKGIECSHILKDIEELRQESTRSLARTRERAESMRRHLQTQISELERQLIQSRALCKSCQKERDEMRQRMQLQVNTLQENFELLGTRIRNMQNQVTALKKTYAIILSDDEESELAKVMST